jgi:hypothetical protein
MNSIEYLKENKIEKGLPVAGPKSGPRPWPLRTGSSRHWPGLKKLADHRAAHLRSGMAVVAHADRSHAPCAQRSHRAHGPCDGAPIGILPRTEVRQGLWCGHSWSTAHPPYKVVGVEVLCSSGATMGRQSRVARQHLSMAVMLRRCPRAPGWSCSSGKDGRGGAPA